MTEIWKDIPGYEGDYQASDFGRVKSLKYGKERILKPTYCGKGYSQVVLLKDKKRKYVSVHRLIATLFIPNPDNLPQVNHRNECKTDNRASNLEWCDQKYNMNYGTSNEKRSESQKKRWAASRQTAQTSALGINQL